MREVEDFNFYARLEELAEELELLNVEAQLLEGQIAENATFILEQQN